MLWIIAASFWAVFGLITGIQVWISMVAHGHSVPLLVGYYVLVWEGWLLATMAILALARRFPVIPPRRRNVLVHVLAACAIAVAHGYYWMALLLAMKPFDRMTAAAPELKMGQILFTRLPLEWLLYCLVLGCAIALDYAERYRERALTAAQLETALAEARLHALELQIRPHFLFNTLNAISSLVRSRKNDEAVAMTAGLAELLRYTLDHAGERRVALEEEVAITRRYLEIESARFPDRLTFAIDLEPGARRAAVPMLLLQPLAENAVRHGIAQSASPGVVELRAYRSGDSLQIDLFNTGQLAATTPRHGIGLANTLERLAHFYGDAGRLELVSARGGVLATISIPWSDAS
jgi:hypothetical protein